MSSELRFAPNDVGRLLFCCLSGVTFQGRALIFCVAKVAVSRRALLEVSKGNLWKKLEIEDVNIGSILTSFLVETFGKHANTGRGR